MTIQVNGTTKATVNNGDKLMVSVTLNKDAGSSGAVGWFISYTGSNTAPTAGHFWPILVMSKADAVDSGLDGVDASEDLGTGRSVFQKLVHARAQHDWVWSERLANK